MITQTSLPSWLTITMASLLLIAACTAKLQSRSNETDNATATSTTTTTQAAPIASLTASMDTNPSTTTTQTALAQSAKADEPIDTTLTLEKLRWKNSPHSVEENVYRLDTSITNHLPHFNAQELFTYYRFLFDLGEDDSMACERCSEEYYSVLKDGGYYNYFYKGIPVIGAYIRVSVDNNSKLTRIVVRFESFKNFDTTFRLTPEQAAVLAVNKYAQARGWSIPQENSYYRKNAMKYYLYSGIKAENKQLVHFFDFINWGVVVFDRSGYAVARESGVRL